MHSATMLSVSMVLSCSSLVVAHPAFEVNNLRPISHRTPLPSSCDLSQASLPAATTPLPSPAADYHLYTVVVGRGTQNYTCAGVAPTAAPVALGAVAQLYNASCIAASYPDRLQVVAAFALNFPLDTDVEGLDAVGRHTFDAATPLFVFTNGKRFAGRKVAAAPAPSTAPSGSVPWLKLQSTDPLPVVGKLQEVYRLTTVGGAAPATCVGRTGAFEVDYTATYWFNEP